MAATNYYVDANLLTGTHDGSSWANAYASLSLAEAGLQKDLDTANEQMTIWCRSTNDSADITWTHIDGFTTSAADYLTIQAASGDEALKTGWQTTRYRLEVIDEIVLGIRDNHVRVVGLQLGEIYIATANKTIADVNTVDAGSDIRWINCYIRGSTNAAANSYGVICWDADATVYVINTIVASLDGIGMYSVSGTLYIYNSVVSGCTYGIYRDAGTWTIKNCAVFNNTDDFAGTPTTIDYCASDDADGTNRVPLNENAAGEWTAAFVDPVNGDFTLKSTGPCYQTGVDNPSAGIYTTDIEGEAYHVGAYSIGVDEYISTATVIPQIMNYYQRLRN